LHHRRELWAKKVAQLGYIIASNAMFCGRILKKTLLGRPSSLGSFAGEVPSQRYKTKWIYLAKTDRI